MPRYRLQVIRKGLAKIYLHPEGTEFLTFMRYPTGEWWSLDHASDQKSPFQEFDEILDSYMDQKTKLTIFRDLMHYQTERAQISQRYFRNLTGIDRKVFNEIFRHAFRLKVWVPCHTGWNWTREARDYYGALYPARLIEEELTGKPLKPVAEDDVRSKLPQDSAMAKAPHVDPVEALEEHEVLKIDQNRLSKIFRGQK